MDPGRLAWTGFLTSGVLGLLSTATRSGRYGSTRSSPTAWPTGTCSGGCSRPACGSDGQPGCYEDIDACDALFLFGHNMAETQTVLWSRVLDRTRGDDPPVVVCVDPRRTPVAEEAERTGGVHLAPR